VISYVDSIENTNKIAHILMAHIPQKIPRLFRRILEFPLRLSFGVNRRRAVWVKTRWRRTPVGRYGHVLDCELMIHVATVITRVIRAKNENWIAGFVCSYI